MCDILKKGGRDRFDSVLDLGCADGAILRLIAERTGAKRAKGIDMNAREVISPPVVLQRANMLDCLLEEQYDLVISNQVFEHIYEPWLPKYFRVLGESCKPGGLILISTPNRWRPRNIVRALTLRRPYMLSPNRGVPPEEHLGHHRECSYRELRTLLRQYFKEPEWQVSVVRTVPRLLESRLRWVANVSIYFALWIFWRLLVVSASQDHYVLARRGPMDGFHGGPLNRGGGE
jgi:SAM-dependent methyltransferase